MLGFIYFQSVIVFINLLFQPSQLNAVSNKFSFSAKYKRAYLSEFNK